MTDSMNWVDRDWGISKMSRARYTGLVCMGRVLEQCQRFRYIAQWEIIVGNGLSYFTDATFISSIQTNIIDVPDQT